MTAGLRASQEPSIHSTYSAESPSTGYDCNARQPFSDTDLVRLTDFCFEAGAGAPVGATGRVPELL